MSKLLAVAFIVVSVSSAHADGSATTQATESPVADDETPPQRPSLVVAPRQPIIEESRDTSTPPLSGRRISGEVLVGAGVGLFGALIGGSIGQAIDERDGCSDYLICGGTGLLWGGSIGFTLAVPVGVYVLGKAGDQTGSFAATLGGSVLGSLAAVGLGAAFDHEALVPVVIALPIADRSSVST